MPKDPKKERMNSFVDKLTRYYIRKVEKWLKPDKDIFLLYTEPVGETPYSIAVRCVLEAAKKGVHYVGQSDFDKNTESYKRLIEEKGLKTILADNKEEGVSKFALKHIKETFKGSGVFNFDDFRYVNQEGVFNAEEAFSFNLRQVLSKK